MAEIEKIPGLTGKERAQIESLTARMLLGE